MQDARRRSVFDLLLAGKKPEGGYSRLPSFKTQIQGSRLPVRDDERSENNDVFHPPRFRAENVSRRRQDHLHQRRGRQYRSSVDPMIRQNGPPPRAQPALKPYLGCPRQLHPSPQQRMDFLYLLLQFSLRCRPVPLPLKWIAGQYHTPPLVISFKALPIYPYSFHVQPPQAFQHLSPLAPPPPQTRQPQLPILRHTSPPHT